MSTTSDISPAELEKLLLEESTTAEQLASMKSTLERLITKVDNLANKDSQQVRYSADIIAEKLASIREIPAQMLQGVSTRSSKQAEEFVSSRINGECVLIEEELKRLAELEAETAALKSLVCETLGVILNAKTLQCTADTLELSRKAQFTNVVHLQELHKDGEADKSGNKPTIVYEQLNTNEFDDVEYHSEFDPIAAAQGKCFREITLDRKPVCENLQPERTIESKLKTKASSRSSSILCQSQGGSDRFESEIGPILAAMALPEVEIFDDPQGRKFNDFILRFTMKYSNLGLRNDLLNHLLLTKLEGYPKAVAKTLPKHIREGNFDVLVEALRAKFEVNDSAMQMKAYLDLKRLRKTGDVTRYCLELERLSREAYPDASEEELSRTRAGELVSQLTDWPEYLQLYTTMEIAPKEAAYDMVKAMAQRCERSKEVAAAMRDAAGDCAKRPQEGGKRNADLTYGTKAQNFKNTPEKAPASANKDVHTKADQRRTVIKCFNCNKKGHLAKDCMLPKRRADNDGATRTRQQTEPPKSFSTSLRNWICRAVKAPDNCDLVGKQMTVEVHLLGMRRKALLDTGSQISILPLQVLKTALEAGFDVDADVKEIPFNQHKKVLDASGNKMSFKGAISLTVQLGNGDKQRIAVFVMSGGDGMMVLGTNALRKFGYSLIHRDYTKPVAQPLAVEIDNACTQKNRATKQQHTQESGPPNSLPVTVTKRVYIRPGQTKLLNVQCKNFTKEGILWSKECLLPDIVWEGGKQTQNLPITNTFAGAKIFRVGEEVGTFEPTTVVEVPPVYPGDMLERTVEASTDREEKLLTALRAKRTSGECDEAMVALVRRYANVFAVSEQELTQTNLVEHNIDTGEAMPIRQKARPVPLATRAELRHILNDLHERKIIEPSKSSWASPIVLVQKKDGTLRLCVDYRKLNQVTKIDSYPLPSIDTILQSLKGKRYYSTLDLSSGYWQIALSEDAKEKSAFTTTEGLYQFRVLPFGLASSPAVFQRLMHAVLGPLLGDEVFCYLDDIMVATETVEQHLHVLERVFQQLSKARLKLNPRKCVLLERKVEFLGHIIDQKGLHMDPAKVEAIKRYPLPRSRSDLRTFLGMCSYYRKFVLGFSKVAAPLHEMTSEKVLFKWDSMREACFERLKSIIVQAPVLAQPDIEAARNGQKPFKIHTDASVQGLGAVLSQEGDDGFLHPVFFASKGLSRSEKNYHVTDLEALAVVFALRKFHMFVYGLPVEVYTDHQALTALFKRTNVSARVLRWALELQKYNLKIIYLKGAANRVADALSRGAIPPNEEKMGSIPNELIVAAAAEEPEWTTELRQNPGYAEVIANLENGKLDKDVMIPELFQKYKVADFVMDQGYLALLDNCLVRRVVPMSKRRAVFEEAHSGLLAGHFGPKKLIRQLSKRLFWETMKRDITQWSQECRECLCHNHRHPMIPGLKPIVTSMPYELVGIDILEMGPTTSGNRYILSVIDHFSKFGGAYAIPSKSALMVARVFFERWVAEGGRQPKCILSDQGGEFDNRLMQELRSLMGIDQVFTKGYNPRENGLTERFNQTLIQMLRKKVSAPTEWDTMLPFCVFAYNTTTHESTGESPFYLLHGFDPYVPWKTVPPNEISNYAVDFESYTQEVAAATKIARDYARKANDKMRHKMKIAYDRDKQVCLKTPKVGDRVYMKVPTEKQSSRNPKLVNPWEGPYRVLDISNNSALITLIDGSREAVRVPFDMLLKLPMGVSNEALRTSKTRGKRGRPKKKKGPGSVVSERVFCFRTLITFEHPLNLRRRCNCGIFEQMAHVALPALKHPMARSKKVMDMFQLANVASISEQECWGDERKEAELRMKNSQYLTPYGIAMAMQAHRRRCHAYAEAIDQAQGMRFEHPALFSWPVKYDVGAYITTALSMLKYVKASGPSTVTIQQIFLALPSAFCRVHADVDYGDNMLVYVYNKWELLAQKLIEMDIAKRQGKFWKEKHTENSRNGSASPMETGDD
ncbi:integrase core domain protein [Ostertagia ostertagi]